MIKSLLSGKDTSAYLEDPSKFAETINFEKVLYSDHKSGGDAAAKSSCHLKKRNRKRHRHSSA